MNLLCKLALIAIPYNLISVAWVQLDLLYHESPRQIKQNFGNTTLLVIAHPDDETMFFGPLMLNLLEEGKYLHILCLSRGDADNHGQERTKEFANVIEKLSPNASLEVVDDVSLKDGFRAVWEPSVIIKYIRDSIKRLDGLGLQNIVTFDAYGVSGHPNHRAIHKATEQLRKSSQLPKSMRFLNLKSVNIFRKYISFLDAIITNPPKLRASFRSQPYFSGDNDEVILALDFGQSARLRTLLSLHESQMVWFRKIYMYLSRNMFLNNLSTL